MQLSRLVVTYENIFFANRILRLSHYQIMNTMKNHNQSVGNL